MTAIDQGAGQPSDVLYLSAARSQAKQALQLAFQASQSIAALQGAQPANNKATTSDTTPDSAPTNNQQGLAKAIQRASDRLSQDQAKVTELEAQIAHSRGAKRQNFISQRDALQSIIALDKALQEQLQKISAFVTSNEQAQGGLAGKIAALKQSVPEVFATENAEAGKPPTASQATATQNANAVRAQSSGMIGQTTYLLTQTRGSMTSTT